METIEVSLKREIFEKLKLIAEPLVDDTSSVIERLLKHWESTRPITSTPTTSSALTPQLWRSTRGEQFIVGSKLRAHYRGHWFQAVITANGIEFEDKVYDNPSSAGIAAKKSIGINESAANTNGWSFWNMQIPNSNQWVSINTIRYTKS